VVVYATKPVGKVIGEFTVSDVHSDSPARLWSRTKAHSGISRVFFDEYFEGREKGFAIEGGESKPLPRAPKPCGRASKWISATVIRLPACRLRF
jgi:predicted transcriptional regulator